MSIIVFHHIQVDCYGQGTWEKLEVLTNKNFNSVFFTDSITGWVVGDSGVIIHTSDGGNSWEIQESNIDNDIVNVFFLDSNYGWASAFNYTTLPYGTILLSTTNGGEDWLVSNYPEENIFITSIVFHDTLSGWMGGTPHAIVHTMDGGVSWQQANIDTSTLAFFPVLNLKFYNEQYGYASGGIFDIAGVIWRTSNGGNTWYAISTDDAPADEVHGLYLFDSVNVMGSGGDPDFGYGVGFTNTSNGGINWDYEEIGVQGIAYDVDFVNSKEGWSPLGPQKRFIYTLDVGESWEEISTPDSCAIFDVVFTDSLHGYAVGNDGAFLKFIPSTQVNIVTHREIDTVVKLLQIYPNPFSVGTTIEIVTHPNSLLSSDAHIIIYDLAGVKLKSINPIQETNNKYSVFVDGNNLKNGIYYYQLVDGNYISKARQMILIR